MKHIFRNTCIALALLAVLKTGASAQELKETIQPLSPKAVKGYMYSLTKDAGGNALITYKIPGKKKSPEVFFEEYSFDKDIKFLANKDVQEKKEQHDDYEQTYYYASVGGSSSFDVLSMKLKLNKVVRLKTWNQEKQSYITQKVISSETLKPKNDDGKVYMGYASFNPADEKKTDVFTLAKIEGKKNVADKFCVLMFNSQLETHEIPLDLNGNYSVVFCSQLASEDVVMVFAPKEKSPDLSKYVFYQFDILGNQKMKVEFKSPSTAMLVTSAYERDGNVYLFGSSEKTTDAFEEVYSEYASIYNPGNTGANNYYDAKWQKASTKKMDNFHLLSFKDGQLAFSSTTPVSEFKSKFKTAPSDKGASPYKGSKFQIQQFFVTPAGDYLVAGQLTNTVSMGIGIPVKSYEDIVCFHFDKAGKLKAQYGIGKMNDDKKSEIFEMPQHFYLSADGKKVYWEIMEVKGTKGYESFMDAYYGAPTFYPLYFPRLGSIDLESSTLSAFKAMGGGKYYLRKDFPGIYDKAERSLTYIGHDEDFEKLWVGKAVMQ